MYIELESWTVSPFQAYCVTEPGAGSDVANIRTSAVKKGNDVSDMVVVCVDRSVLSSSG